MSIIHVDIPWVYRCPKCDRWDTSAAPRYLGPITLRTQEEVRREQDHRRGMLYDPEYRMEVLSDLMRTLISFTGKKADKEHAMSAVKGPF